MDNGLHRSVRLIVSAKNMKNRRTGLLRNCNDENFLKGEKPKNPSLSRRARAERICRSYLIREDWGEPGAEKKSGISRNCRVVIG
jgi:hypothetical protein